MNRGNFRVNYGNGQVSHGMASRKEALAYIATCKADHRDPYAGHYFVQFREDGEWFTDARARRILRGECP